ncbi:MAG: pyridoxal phosphate-dependent aminotransferase [Gammaproteobacteria bacterium]|nr:pyridoxal phosphate-dependent aminotransferase [Gammaproteobacteria bacterium]
MELSLSGRARNLKPSPTLAVTALAASLRAAGKDIIGLGAGEPDFDTPDHIKAAAIKAIEEGFTKYTAVDGTAELKAAIITKFARDNKLEYKPDQIIVSCGGKHSFYNLAQALLNPGDEVIIPAPYWVSYPPIVELAEGVPIIIEGTMAQGFKITPEQLEAAITARTKMVIINSPSNPTGAVYSRDELSALADVLLKHPQVLVVSDDIYESIVWGEPQNQNILTVCPELYERTMILNGVSKAYSMTGWRIGYAAGPAQIIKGMKSVQSQSTSNPTSISQAASTTALEGDQSSVNHMLQVFKRRHEFVLERLNKINGIECPAASGAFYLFPDFSQVIARLDGVENDIQLGEWLLDKAEVAMVPGSAFGAEGHMRLSFATSEENLNKALDRLEKALA